MKISIIGTGIFSLALALNIKSNWNVKMWSENEELVNHFKENHDLKPISSVSIPDNINVYNDIKEVLEDTNLIILATSAKFIRSSCVNMLQFYKENTPICIASKGIENETCYFLSDIVQDVLKTPNVAIISGPTFAKDLIAKEIAALTLASTNDYTTKIVTDCFDNNHLKFKVSHDIYGTELCGSIKNVIAIGTGILDGLNASESTKMFFITEAINDIKELLINLKCDPETILTYAGIGDLILTSTSPSSRNYKFGNTIVTNKISEDFLVNNTVEGYYTLVSVRKLITNHQIKTPTIDIIYNIAIKKENPKTILDFLINK